MSSKGQVVIPENIRRQLKLKSGTRFIVLGENDVVILKNIVPPSLDEFSDLITKARRDGKQARIKRSDIKDAVMEARGKKK